MRSPCPVKWGGFTGIGLIGAFSINQALKNSPPTGADYTRLEELLAAQQWQDADQETLNIMLKIANREGEGWLDTTSLQNFPCQELAKLDQLWGTSKNTDFSGSGNVISRVLAF